MDNQAMSLYNVNTVLTAAFTWSTISALEGNHITMKLEVVGSTATLGSESSSEMRRMVQWYIWTTTQGNRVVRKMKYEKKVRGVKLTKGGKRKRRRATCPACGKKVRGLTLHQMRTDNPACRALLNNK